MSDKFFVKNRKGISVMVGYVLLIVFAIVIGAIVFQWLRTYVPAQSLECTEGVSLFIEEAAFNESSKKLDVTIKNNGRFNVAGYFIHVTNESGQELATIDMSVNLNQSFGGIFFGGSVLFASGGTNSMKPGESEENVFDVPDEVGEPLSVRVIPARFQEQDNRNRFISCGDSSVIQKITEPVSGSSEISICGNGLVELGETCDDNCDQGTPNECENPIDNGDGCSSTCQIEPGWECSGEPSVCSEEQVCGNGIIETPEACDDDNTDSGDGCSGTCSIESGWQCSETPSVCTFEIGYFGFESGEQGWVDGGTDSQRFSDDEEIYTSKVLDDKTNGGEYSWNIDHNTASSYTEQSFDFTPYSQVTMNWWGYYRGFEDHEPDCLELKIDGTKIDSWGTAPECDSTIIEDGWISHSVVLSDSSHTFDSSVTIRFEGEMDSDWDDFYADGIELIGQA